MATTTRKSIDLTPFGFTPTESTIFSALLARGPSTGYAIARVVSIARANAYHALGGLVAKGAAVTTADTPPRYRAVRPEALYAQIVDQQTRRLDQLEDDLSRAPAGGADPVVRVSGRRAVVELMSRTAARAPGAVTLLGALPVLTSLVPVLRKRAADGAPTTVWVIGSGGELPVPITDAVPEARVREFFPAEVVILLTAAAALVGQVEGTELDAYWTTDAMLVGTARAAVAALVAGAPA